MGTQRLGLLAIALVTVIGSIFYFQKQKGSSSAPLRICTWSAYADSFQQFEKDTGIKLEISFISSNEELLAKFKAGATGFDVIQPSDYMVRNMSRLGMLAPLDHSQLANIKNIDPFFTNLPYDQGHKYSVPFAWGTTGIALNTKKVKVPESGVSWSMLFESPDFAHTSVMDDMREAFAAALLWKGFPINATETKALALASQTIADVRSKILMFSLEPRQLLASGEIYIAHAYSVDGIQAGVDNPDVKYFVPAEGATLWTDNFAIPTTSTRSADALKFINYFMEANTAARVAQTNHLATANQAAREKLPPEQLNDPGLYPASETMKKLQLMDDLGDSLNHINRLWNELKNS